MIQVLNCIGIPDDNRIEVNYNDGTLRDGEFGFYGNNAFIEQLKSRNLELQSLVLGGASQNANVALKRFDLIFNSICDPDANEKSLSLVEQFVKGGGFSVINHPIFIRNSFRDTVYQRCQQISGLYVPKTIRIQPSSLAQTKDFILEESIKIPFIMRPANGHGGRGMVKISNDNEFDLLEQFAFDGTYYYVTEYVDFKSKDGLYRKSRFIVIDGKVYPRHHIMSKDWKIHASTRAELIEKDKKYENEEREFLKAYNGEIDEQCNAIYEELGLDIFGIDCHISDDGSVLLFEANACMRYFGANQNNYVDGYTLKIKDAIKQLIIKFVET